ncbi:glycerol-3-phosphate dehydrogenase [Yersinia pestis]|uniref:Glycerol-3-phosphate dehydrogenase n=1 Tax=Yersinia pseudotuberculosis TaxID=633 RepID=A0ABM7AFN2_YERPU|nr:MULTISPECIES: hypothetical protein [Yersinia pseudotuberculosis complex]ADV97147.1 hypothetical protein YPC_0407 [Yersinia pestis biovar Medievalis str. Harbin 35]EEO78582.1 hypothetical protein YP516_0100 [Yersinia pestis Nepal516]EEO78937.1 hypothetical protein YPF_4594 [Yersinia pestis biovar Orientalis str. India 195]EEO85928.1 hypothetical protein YPH_1816 [Yersinia pestis biovar Orientalis str. PEXU2]EEO92107.1 hypothetical protein YPS_1061 [Yersinia pestis Pestoides A]EKS43823.1 hyp
MLDNMGCFIWGDGEIVTYFMKSAAILGDYSTF